jgi:hypothetical protein
MPLVEYVVYSGFAWAFDAQLSNVLDIGLFVASVTKLVVSEFGNVFRKRRREEDRLKAT